MDVSTKIEKTEAFQKEFLQTEVVRQPDKVNEKAASMLLSLPELCGILLLWRVMACLRVDYSLPVFKLVGSVKAPWLLTVITHEGRWAH